ncbi:MAG TPA: hypothetical protein VHT75_03525 [Acidimicrobiales bacterium]|nr:hypothetical protein [Acidimicrobiales bacterium]
MSAPNKSFFSSLAGVVTGIAGLLTAAVAVFGVAVNQGWLHGSSRSNPLPGSTAAPASGGTPNGTNPQYAVAPPAVTFQALGGTTTAVRVTNTGVVPITVTPPQVTGADASHFRADPGDCAAPVDPGRSCQLQVSFNPAPGTFNATLVVQVSGAVRATEVPLQAHAIL